LFLPAITIQIITSKVEKCLSLLRKLCPKEEQEVKSASPKEMAMIEKRVKEYEKNPTSFVPRKKRVTR
jgi:hypothetical protein